MKDFTRYARQEVITVDGRRVRLFSAPPDGHCPSDKAALDLPLLFLHGLGCAGSVWLPAMEEMATRGLSCTSVAPDMPGYGRSAGPTGSGAFGIDALADWAVRFLDARKMERAHVAGNSMGCQVALALARRHPDRVGGLVLQGPTTGTRYVPAWRYVTGLAVDGFRETLRYNACLAKMYCQMGPVRYMKTARKMLEDDVWEHIDAVKAPVLVVRGGRDAIVSDEEARRLAAALPDAVYTPLDSEAHAIEFNNPPMFVEAMMTFLTRVEERLRTEAQPKSNAEAAAPPLSPVSPYLLPADTPVPVG